MDEKHIIAPSRKKEILQKIGQLKENFQKSVPKAPPKPVPPPPPKEIPKINKAKISQEAGEKILTYTLVFAVVSILLMGIILSLSNKPKQISYQPVIPTILPTKSVSVTPTSVQFKSYTNGSPVYSFKYPSNWNIYENPLKITNPANSIFVSVSIYNPSLVGVTYCGANPEVKPRCEALTQGSLPFSIDWSENTSGPFNAAATSTDGKVGVNIAMETNADKTSVLKNAENQELFRAIVSSFSFTN